jgi:L-asparaginase II
MSSRFARLAVVTRNELQESWHLGAVAVAAGDGALVARAGDANLETYVRSAAKPWQAMPLLEAGGGERFNLDDEDLALICASHSGTDAHAARAASLLERGGFTVADLLCGPHPPIDAATAEALRQRAEVPDALRNNCSGKHAGMLLACRALGLDAADYVAPSHGLQLSILDWTARFCGIDPATIGVGIDGCSAPALRLSLHAAARGYAALADPEASGVGSMAAELAGHVVRAMTSAPFMVAGPGRFTTRLMEVTGGRVLGKEGAEGFYAAAVRGPVALGVAIKVADGGERCRDGVVIDVLRQLGSLSGAEVEELGVFHRPAIRNHAGRAVGAVVPDVELVSAGGGAVY